MKNIDSWQLKRLAEIGTIYSGSTPSTTKPSLWDGDIVWVTPSDLSQLNTPYLTTSGKKITPQGLKGCSAHLLPPGSIILSSRAPIGYLAINTVECCTNQGCKSFKLKPEYNSEFVYYNLNFNVNKIKGLGEGTTFAEISKTALSKIEVLFLEDKKEQDKIAAVLSTIDLAITQTEAIIVKQQRIKTGLMQDLLTKGIDENGNIRSEATHEFKDSSIGRIPVEWEVKKIAEAGDVKLGRQTAPRYKLGINSRPYLRVVNISEDRLDLSDIKSMDFTPDEFKKYSLQIGDVLLTEGDLVSAMNVGRSAVFREEGQETYCFQNSLIRFRPSEEKTAEYFHFAFCYLRAVGYFANATMATTVFHLSAGRLKKLYVPVPKTSEQVSISKIIAQQDKNIDTEILKREKLLLLKTGLMQDLLTGKVRVTPLLKKEPASR